VPYDLSVSVCLSVCLSVCVAVFVTTVSRAKTAEPIEMLFGVQTRVGARNRVLDGVQMGPPGKYD